MPPTIYRSTHNTPSLQVSGVQAVPAAVAPVIQGGGVQGVPTAGPNSPGGGAAAKDDKTAAILYMERIFIGNLDSNVSSLSLVSDSVL